MCVCVCGSLLLFHNLHPSPVPCSPPLIPVATISRYFCPHPRTRSPAGVGVVALLSCPRAGVLVAANHEFGGPDGREPHPSLGGRGSGKEGSLCLAAPWLVLIGGISLTKPWTMGPERQDLTPCACVCTRVCSARVPAHSHGAHIRVTVHGGGRHTSVGHTGSGSHSFSTSLSPPGPPQGCRMGGCTKTGLM